MCVHAGWRRAAWSVGALALAVYLWNANRWVPRWLMEPEEQMLRAAAPLGPLPSIDQFSVDELETHPDTRLQKVSVLGWILPPDEWRGPNAGATRCEIVFKGDRAWYRLEPDQYVRKDVRDIFRVENVRAVTGYRARFSPVAMKKGTYRMGVVVCAGTNDLAVAWAPFAFIQDRQGFRTQ